MSRYKVEKYNSGSDWRFLSSLNFLEEVNLTSCPEDVSPLFSLLTGADSQNEDDKLVYFLFLVVVPKCFDVF